MIAGLRFRKPWSGGSG